MRYLFATIFLLFTTTILYAFDFSSECETGQTLYYNIIDSIGYRVGVTFPGPSIDSAWLNHVKPSGDLAVPSRVNHNGQQYLVTEVETCAFAKCTDLSGKLEIPKTITAIGSYAFLHCGNISVLCFNCEQCTSAFGAFEGCAFDSIYLGDNVTKLPDGIFANSNGITTLQIPSSVRTIGERAFYNCLNLEEIVFSDSIITIGDFAFSDCPLLENVNLINADIIGDCAFYNAHLLQSVRIGENVSRIGRMSFFGSRGLRSLTIGSNVREIADYAFCMADSIDIVYCYALLPPAMGEMVFSPQSQNGCLVVNCEALDYYQSASGWNGFNNIVVDQSYKIEAIPNHVDYGFVTGSGEGFCFGNNVTIEAMPYEGFHFQNWSDGFINNPRDIVIESDTIVIALFAVDANVGFEEEKCLADIKIVISDHTVNMFVPCLTVFQVFDVLGRCYYRSATEEDNVSCILPRRGMYIVSLGNGNVKKTIVM